MCGRGRFALEAGAVRAAAGLGARRGAPAEPPAARDGARGDGDAGQTRDRGSEEEDDAGEPREEDADLQTQLEAMRRENFGPAMAALIVVQDPKETGKHVLRKAQWGLLPKKLNKPVAAGDFFQRFNARKDNLEAVHSTRIGRQHCVVLFNGFYEWKKDQDPLSKKLTKQPYYIYPKNGGVLRLAGLYENSVDPGTGEELTTFAIITVNAAKSFQWLHHRMPAVLADDDAVDAWLSASTFDGKTQALLQSDETSLAWHPVTAAMGKTSYQEPDCTKPVKLEKNPSVLSLWSKKQKHDSNAKTSSSSGAKPSPQNTSRVDSAALKREEDDVVILDDVDAGGTAEKKAGKSERQLTPSKKRPAGSSPLKTATKKAAFPSEKGQATLGAFFAKKS